MKVNKLFIVSIVLLAILTLGAASAADGTADDLAVEDVGDLELEVPASDEIIAVGDTDDVAVGESSEGILGVSQDEKLSDASVIVINKDNYMDYFNQTNYGKLVDSIKPGTTLDFQGSIINTNKSQDIFMDVSIPVNIVSTTGDAYIDLNASGRTYAYDSFTNSFTINREGSGSNITGISFHNTHILITNATNIVLDNIIIVNDQAITGGSTSIRYNSSYITFKNSYLYSDYNRGAAFTLCWADHCTIDNNTFVTGQHMGSYNLIYYYIPIGQFGIKPTDNTLNVYNNFTNNIIRGENNAMPRLQSTAGGNNLFENNTFFKCTFSPTVMINSSIIGNIFTGGSLSAGSNSILCNNYVNGTLSTGQGSVTHGNTVLGTMTISKGAEVYNNTVGGLTLNGADALVHDNVITGATTINAATNSQIYNNTFIGDYTIKFNNAKATNITFTDNDVFGNIQFSNQNAKNNKIINNTITASADYAIDLKTYTDTGNNISGNILYSKDRLGNDAVNHAEDATLILDNYPNVNATINVSVMDIKVGETAFVNVTVNETSMTSIDIYVNGKKYNMILSEGKGSLELKDLLAENYDVIVISTDKTYGAQNSTSFKVSKNICPILVDAPDKTQWIDSNITVTIFDATGIVTLAINGSEFTEELVDGVAIFTVPDFKYGDYDFNVTYKGDYKYFGNETNGTLTVSRNKEVKIMASDIVVEKLADKFTAKFLNYIYNPIDGANVNITIADSSYKLVTDENGTASVDLALTRGKYNVTVEFIEIPNEYGAATAYYTITVIDDSFIKIISVDGAGLITGFLYDALGNPIANATVVATMNGTETDLITNDSGLFEFQAADGFKVTFEFAGDNTTNPSDTFITVNIVPVPKDVSVIKIVSVDAKGLITGSLSVGDKPIGNATIVASMNGTSVNLTTDVDGLFEFQAEDGSKVTFLYAGDENTTSSDVSITVSIVDIPKDVSVIKIVSVDAKGFITGSLSAGDKSIANAIIIASMNGTDTNLITNDVGLFQFQASDGFKVTFLYAGDENTTSSEVSIVVSVVPVPKDVSVIKIVSVDAKGLITGSLSAGGKPIANAIVVATVNGTDDNLITDNDGLFQFQAIDGIESIFVYAGDYNTTSADASISVSIAPVPKDVSIIKITSVNGTGLVTGSLSVNSNPIANAVVVATVNGTDVNLTTNDAGLFEFQAQNGLEVVFKYAGNDTITSSDATFILNNVAPVVEPVTNVTVIVNGVEFNATIENGTVVIDFPIEPVANVTVIVNGVEYNATIENGTVVIDVPIEPVANVTVIVNGVEYKAAIVNGTVVIDIPIVANNISDINVDVVDGSGLITGSLSINGAPAADATILYTVNTVIGNTTTDANGLFNIQAESNALVNIIYAGSPEVTPAEATILLKDLAHPRVASIIKSEEFTQYAVEYKDGERGGYFKVQLVDANGNALDNKPVKIGFNGVVYNKTTDENGWAELQINLAKAGEYTFAIAFLGDDNYNASFVVQKIVINKKKTSISASAKTFKSSAKTKKYTVTLKTDKGSSIDGKTYLSAGKKLTVTVNGKTYAAKTNAKGQATFKLSITKKGKFSAAVKFKGDNSYLASSKTVKIVIK